MVKIIKEPSRKNWRAPLYIINEFNFSMPIDIVRFQPQDFKYSHFSFEIF